MTLTLTSTAVAAAVAALVRAKDFTQMRGSTRPGARLTMLRNGDRAHLQMRTPFRSHSAHSRRVHRQLLVIISKSLTSAIETDSMDYVATR